jgi:hypothetical protein
MTEWVMLLVGSPLIGGGAGCCPEGGAGAGGGGGQKGGSGSWEGWRGRELWTWGCQWGERMRGARAGGRWKIYTHWMRAYSD